MRGPAPALALLVLLVAGQAAPAADAALPSAAAPRPALQRVPGAGGGALLLLRLRGGAAGKYYRALGLEAQGPAATAEEIKKAYKRQALRWHPDRCKPEDKCKAEEKFKEVSEAYETLHDPDRKAFYDRWGDEGIKAQNGREPSRDEVRRGPAGMRRRDFDGSDFRDPFDLFREFFGVEDEGFAGMGGGGMGVGRDMFGRSVFRGPGGVNVVVGSGTSPTSMLLQVLIGAVDRWASRQRQAQTSAQTESAAAGEAEARLRRYHLMVPCRLGDVLTGCSKTVAGPPGTQETFDLQVMAGWKDGTRVTFAGDNDEGPWEVVCVIRIMPHAHLMRDGNHLRYRVCVTAAKLDQPGGCIRARVPLLVPSPPRAYASADKPKRGGKRNPRGAMDEEGDAGKGAGAAHRTQDVVFDEGAFELSFPPGGVMGHKICEQRVRGEGMPIRGGGSQGQERGDLIVELLVGNRLQAALMSSGLVPLLLSVWGATLHLALELRNKLLLLSISCLRSSVVRRVEAEARSVYARVSAYLAPAMPAIKEALAHLALFGVLLALNPVYAYMHALSLMLRVFAHSQAGRASR